MWSPDRGRGLTEPTQSNEPQPDPAIEYSCGHKAQARFRQSGEGLTESTKYSEPKPHPTIEYSCGDQGRLKVSVRRVWLTCKRSYLCSSGVNICVNNILNNSVKKWDLIFW